VTRVKEAAKGRQAGAAWRGATTELASAILCGCALLASAATRSEARVSARAAGSLNVKDEGALHFVKSSGSTIIDEGRATGTIPGDVRIHFVYNGNPNVSAQITIYGQHGTIDVRGSGRLSSPTNPNPSFSGTLSITGGSGRYSHASGSGKLYGVFHRRSYGMIVQAQGTLHY
jgi:hypothetical protein